MQVISIIQAAYKMASGDDENLPQSDPTWSKCLDILNNIQRDWENEQIVLPNERWLSLERTVSFELTADNNVFTLPTDARELAMHPLNGPEVSIVKNYGQADESVLLTLRGLNPTQFALRDDKQAIYTYDYANKRLTLKVGVVNEMVAQGSCHLVLTYYKKVDELMNADDEIEIHEPNWAIYMLAAEIARTDVVQSGQYGNLVALAQNTMTSMINYQRGLRIAEMDPWGVKDHD